VNNVGALLAQLVLEKTEEAQKYLLVTLAVADLLMGLYLAPLAYIDLSYSSTFYMIVSEWTGGVTCSILSLVNFLSSEVSLLILSILSLARVASIQKIGRMRGIKSIIKVVCGAVWTLTSFLGVVYVSYLYMNNIRVRNNMCVFLGVLHKRYITFPELLVQGLLIGVNTICLLMMIGSAFSMLYIVTQSLRSVTKTSGQKVKAREGRILKIGLKLMLLVFCNVLTWLPILVVSTLLLQGTTDVHEAVLQWVAVLGLPICACVNPVLYNLASFKLYICKKG